MDLVFTAMKKKFRISTNIKIRLAFQFMLIVASILLFFALLVYFFSYTSLQNKFRVNLLNRAQNTAVILIDVKEIDSTLLKKIHQNTISWQDEEIMVVDTNFKVLYLNNVSYIKPELLLSFYSQLNTSYFEIGDKEGVFYRHNYRGNISYVYVLARDTARQIYLKELRNILFWSIIFSAWISVLFSYLFSRRAMKPIADIIKSVKTISASNLSLRLDEGKGIDELETLAMTFNEMLCDIEASFRNQADFISNASHELRTPITIMIAESDYFLTRDHTLDEYRKHILNHSEDVKQLNQQINSLLHLAEVTRSKSLHFLPLRIDEILFDAVHQIKGKYGSQKIVLKIQYPDNEDLLLVRGHFGLLIIAFRNLIDNACKFSETDVCVSLQASEGKLQVLITDKGIGIPDNEKAHIFNPFIRASNAKYKSGFGIGLSLAARIFDLHHAIISIRSQEHKGTEIEVDFLKT